MAEELWRVEYLIEATTREEHLLWCVHSNESEGHLGGAWQNRRRLAWPSQSPPGRVVTVGEVKIGKKMWPICVSIDFAYIDGHLVAFWRQCSAVTHIDIAEEWLRANVPAWSIPGRKCNSENFRHFMTWLGL